MDQVLKDALDLIARQSLQAFSLQPYLVKEQRDLLLYKGLISLFQSSTGRTEE